MKTACPSATISTTNPSWTAVGANPGLHGEKPVTNRKSYSTANRGNVLIRKELNWGLNRRALIGRLAPSILNLGAIRRWKRPALRSGRFIPRKKVPGNN
jgi:hypothetical protein